MNFDLTPDQRALRQTASELCAKLFPMSVVREIADTGCLDRARWGELATAGLFSLHIPEQHGGLGLGMAELSIAFEELGKALVPGPLIGAATRARLVDSALPAPFVAIIDASGRCGPYVIEHFDSVEALLVLHEDEVTAVDVNAVGRQRQVAVGEFLDPLTPVAVFEDLPYGDCVGDAELAAELRRDGALLVAALSAGLAAASCERAARFALDREQFGRPIGAFQAVKHMLADMRVRAELAQVAVEAAAVLIDEGDRELERQAVSSAKLVAGEAAIENGRSCVQIHGGMGFAWEVDAHLYLKRAWVLDQQFGSCSSHARTLAKSWD